MGDLGWVFFAHQFDASLLSAAQLVGCASSPREKCPCGSSSLPRGAPVVVERWAGLGWTGGLLLEKSPKAAGASLLWEYPHLVLDQELLPNTTLQTLWW